MKFYIVAVLLASASAIHLRGDPPAKEGEDKGTKLPNMGRS